MCTFPGARPGHWVNSGPLPAWSRARAARESLPSLDTGSTVAPSQPGPEQGPPERVCRGWTLGQQWPPPSLVQSEGRQRESAGAGHWVNSGPLPAWSRARAAREILPGLETETQAELWDGARPDTAAFQGRTAFLPLPQRPDSQQTSMFSRVVTTGSPQGVRYKERLQVKYLKATRKKSSLDISRWRFLNPTLDAEDEHARDEPSQPSQSRGGVRPVYLGSKPRVQTGGKHQRWSPKEQVCFSRQNCAQQTRRERVAALERKLLQHPLGLYEHYEQGMPPELFKEVLSVLDPDMCVNREAKAPCADESISKMALRFQDWDASLSEAGRMHAVDDARSQDPGTKKGAASETSRDSDVGPADLQFQKQSITKEEKRQMFAFQAFRQYLTSNRLRVPEFMSEIFSEEEGSEG
ncbi:unnamed protein product [Lota lota]